MDDKAFIQMHADVAVLKGDVKDQGVTLDKLNKVVCEDNGHSMLSRMKNVEAELKRLRESLSPETSPAGAKWLSILAPWRWPIVALVLGVLALFFLSGQEELLREFVKAAITTKGGAP